MSGAEAILVLGVISSIISIVDGTKQVYDTATNAQGLPEAFREVAARLPIVQNIMGLAKRLIEEGDADENSYKGAKDVVEGCKKKAKKLEELFQKIIPLDGASRAERYISAVRTVGKGSRVEALMKGMLEDVQLLAINHGMTTVTDTERKEVAEAIKELSEIPPSVPDSEFHDPGITMSQYGSGTQQYIHGNSYASGGGPIFSSGDHQTINYGKG